MGSVKSGAEAFARRERSQPLDQEAGTDIEAIELERGSTVQSGRDLYAARHSTSATTDKEH